MMMNNIKIPKSFYIGGQKMRVVIGQDQCLRSSDLGLCQLAKGVINISPDQTDDSMQNTFVHELIHAALDTLGRYSDSNDECFVSSLASVLTEAVRSMTYDDGEKRVPGLVYNENSTATV